MTDVVSGPDRTVPAHGGAAPAGGTRFGYMFPGLAVADPAAVVAALNALGAAMEEPAPVADPPDGRDTSTIPPIYTFWAQFVDHDLTADTDRNSPVGDPLVNLRRPMLDLDPVYGDGPAFPGDPQTEAAALYDGILFRLGTMAEVDRDGVPIRGEHVPPDVPFDLQRDLPRDGVTARIADDRNDENLAVAQLHVAFLRFHNATVEWVRANEPGLGGDAWVFARARQLVRWHYQWLIVNDFLRTVTLHGAVDSVLIGGNRYFSPTADDVFLPLEFSMAAYGFWPSTVRATYDWNQNFPNSTLPLLFTFTGHASTPIGGSTDVLPFTWVADWQRLVDHGSPFPDRFARRIGTRLASPLRALHNEGNREIRTRLTQSATRNLLRSHQFALPTGQQVAAALGARPLSEAELQQDNGAAVNAALVAGGFLQNTPLWFYVLKEAEVRARGNSLGEVGSRIVCETVIGLLRADPTSYLTSSWDPSIGVRNAAGDPVVTISDFLRFAGVM